VAALNHPHIVTVYSVEEDSGHHFLTMELVEGKTLHDLLGGEGLPLARILDLASALAEALAAAHEKGIVHRDLKPANVMVAENGRVKVLDFGIAKLTRARAAYSEETAVLGAAHTSAGVLMGTMPYMSPEQVEGQPLDARSDLFSLGVMLHEMTTGRRPFQGTSTAALLSAILRDTPPPVDERRRDIPAGLTRLIARCLEKDRGRRIETAGQVREAIEALRGAPAADARRSIVVLPFANSSPDAENEYFSDGLTEEIISDLSKVHLLSVISRTSSMQLKGARKDVRTIGRELGVRYVLEGSVRKAGSSLRITAQLVDARDDAQLWSDKYSGTIDDVFEVQERVSREIVRALDITLTSRENARLAERPIVHARAFERVLQARQELRRMSAEAIARAAARLREAAQIEGETPALRALQAWARVMQIRAGVSRDLAPLDEAEREAHALIALAPGAPYGYALLGHIGYERGHLPEAVWNARSALAREPNDADTLFYMGISYIAAGQNESAQEVVQRILACDPLAPVSALLAGVWRWFVGQPAAAVTELRRGLEIDPPNFILHWSLGYTYASLGRLAEAAREANVLQMAAPDAPYTRQLLSLLDALDGRPREACARLADIDTTSLDSHHLFHLGEAFALAGDPDRALPLLARAVGGFYPYPFLAEHCRFLDPLRPSPRFVEILGRARELAEAFPRREAELGPVR
jgi:TolB-like protein/Flp pilus assembly protein TadD